jgi:hypothetical protein
MIIRAHRGPDDRFAIIPNPTIFDRNLSHRALGVLVRVLAMPDGWSVRSEHLTAMYPGGRDAVRTALTELERLGYLHRHRSQDHAGRWRTDSVIFDTPSTGCGEACRQLNTPKPDNPASDNQAL